MYVITYKHYVSTGRWLPNTWDQTTAESAHVG